MSDQPIWGITDEDRAAAYPGANAHGRHSDSAQLTSAEYTAWHDYGRLPERLHASEATTLAEKYVSGYLTLSEFEEELDGMMGLSRAAGVAREALLDLADAAPTESSGLGDTSVGPA